MSDQTVFEVGRDDLRRTRFVTVPVAEPAAGEVLLRIERFGFTSNNVTYGAVGDSIGYWSFFPAEPGWGRIPVWGIAVVERSRHDELPAGERASRSGARPGSGVIGGG